MRKYLLLLLSTICYHISFAQHHTINNDRIASLQVVANTDWMGLPAIKLGSSDRINLSFDDLTHEYTRYTYNITHCEADWSESEELFTNDYLGGFQNGLTIDDYEESINTNTLYLHYNLQIPNEGCSIKMSGNYKIDVIDEENDEIVFTARFMVYEPLVSISSEILSNTDIDIRHEHQQLNLCLRYPSSLSVTDARRQFRVCVMQNQRSDNLVWCPPAPIVRPGILEWTHTKELIFTAGNEYHKFEILDPHRNSMGVDKIVWDENWYNVHLFHDYPRRAYVYDEDANGSFYIRNSDNVENNITSDYVMMHFYLDTPQLDGDVYVDGKWVVNKFSESYKMEYDYQLKCYHLALPLKFGYYNYQYLYFPYDNMPSKNISHTRLTEGDFFQTENNYSCLVYYKADSDRTWRLVGISDTKK